VTTIPIDAEQVAQERLDADSDAAFRELVESVIAEPSGRENLLLEVLRDLADNDGDRLNTFGLMELARDYVPAVYRDRLAKWKRGL